MSSSPESFQVVKMDARLKIYILSIYTYDSST